jgi:hypothetical protein
LIAGGLAAAPPLFICVWSSVQCMILASKGSHPAWLGSLFYEVCAAGAGAAAIAFFILGMWLTFIVNALVK